MVSEYKNQLIDYRYGKYAMIRSCVLPLSEAVDLIYDESILVTKVKSLLDNEFISDSIFLATPSLIEKYKNREKEGKCLKKISVSIAKYLIRMSYRPTPFGGFASVGSIRISTEDSKIENHDRKFCFYRPELTNLSKSKIIEKIANDAYNNNLLFELNDTLVINDESFYIYKYKIDDRGKRIYFREEFDLDGEIKSFFDYIEYPKISESIVSYFVKNGTNESQALSILNDLIDEEILTVDYLTDITSDNWNDFIIGLDFVEDKTKEILEQVNCHFERFSQVGANGVRELNALIEKTLGFGKGDFVTNKSVKLDLFQSFDAGNLNKKIIDNLILALPYICDVSPRNPDVEIFCERFLDTYGEYDVPLSKIVDNLENLGVSVTQSNIPLLLRASGFSSRKTNEPPEASDIVIFDTDNKYLEISSEKEGKKKKQLYSPRINDLVVWLSMKSSDLSDTMEIKSVGAQDPRRIMGRFFYGVERLKNDILLNESKDIQYLEVVHLPQDYTNSICERPYLGPKELGIRAGKKNGKHRYKISDILVTVRSNEIKLKLRSTGEEVRPVMSNAHNFNSTGNLPVYKFLNLLICQSPMVSLKSLRKNHQDQVYVPGLKYKNFLIAHPTWKIFRVITEKIRSIKDTPKRLSFLKKHLLSINAPKVFIVKQGDIHFPVNQDIEWMLHELVKICLKESEILLEDAAPELKNGKGIISEVYNNEVLIPLFRKSSTKIYDKSISLAQDYYNNWLSFKIYSSINCLDLLIIKLTELLDSISSSNINFFFVRYHDKQGSHLRLRIRYEDEKLRPIIFLELNEFLESYTLSSFIKNYSIGTYRGEVDRYGGQKLLPLCEEIFCIESRAIGYYLNSLSDLKTGFIESILIWIDEYLYALGYKSIEERYSFSKRASDNYSYEFGFDSRDRKKIGKIYTRVNSSIENGALIFAGINKNNVLASSSTLIYEKMKGFERFDDEVSGNYDLCWSMIHMRFNRIFSQSSRLQEAICWNLLSKCYLKEVSINRKRQGGE